MQVESFEELGRLKEFCDHLLRFPLVEGELRLLPKVDLSDEGRVIIHLSGLAPPHNFE